MRGNQHLLKLLPWSTWLSCAREWTPIPLVDHTTSELIAGSSGGLSGVSACWIEPTATLLKDMTFPMLWWAFIPNLTVLMKHLRIWLLSLAVVLMFAKMWDLGAWDLIWLSNLNLTGMLPHKTKRGQAALERLKVFDGIPPPYDKASDYFADGLNWLGVPKPKHEFILWVFKWTFWRFCSIIQKVYIFMSRALWNGCQISGSAFSVLIN